MPDTPQEGKLYRHYKGGLYKVISLGAMERTCLPVVIYRAINTNEVWVRPLIDWWSLTVDGKERFTLVEEKDAGS